MVKLNATAQSLLGYLHDRPMTGWDLFQTVEATIGNFWNVTRSQVYRELRTLEQEGLVIGGERGTRDKRAYTITEAGKKAFSEFINQQPGDVVARYPLLLTTWFSDHLPPETFERFLRVHREQHQKQLEFYRQVFDAMEDHTTPAARALRFGLYYEEAAMRWFDSLDCFGGQERRNHPEPPRPETPERPRPD